MFKFKFFIPLFCFLFLAGVVFAQEETPPAESTGVGGGNLPVPSATEMVNLDEDIQPQDLEVSEPKALPDSPFYFLKNWAREIQSVLTFNPVKKAELRMKFANEKLMEAEKIAKKTDKPEIIKKATENYQKEVEKVKAQVDKIKEKAKDNLQVDKFLNKFIDQQILHQKLLQKLENQVSPEAFEKIEEAREKHLEIFQDVMLKLEDRGEKQLEILENLKSKLEEVSGKEIPGATCQTDADCPKQEVKGMYSKCKEGKCVAIGTSLLTPSILEKIEEGKTKISEKLGLCKNLCGDGICQEVVCMATGCPCAETPKTCPQDCKKEGESQVIPSITDRELKLGWYWGEKNQKKPDTPDSWVHSLEGTRSACWHDPKVKCGTFPTESPSEKPIACAQVITYKKSNDKCFLCPDACSPLEKCTEVQMKECEEKGPIRFIQPTPMGCKNLWWYDNEHKNCQQKKFCGMYMYLGLHTFETKEKCEAALKQ